MKHAVCCACVCRSKVVDMDVIPVGAGVFDALDCVLRSGANWDKTLDATTKQVCQSRLGWVVAMRSVVCLCVLVVCVQVVCVCVCLCV